MMIHGVIEASLIFLSVYLFCFGTVVTMLVHLYMHIGEAKRQSMQPALQV